MPCESFQTALTEAAAGAPASDALRSHLIVCPDCRSTFASEQALFTAVDSGLRSVANAEVPPSLIPAVRARLETSAPRRRWPVPVLVPVGVALVLAVFAVRLLDVPAQKLPAPAAIASTTEPPRPPSPGPTVPLIPPPKTNANVASISRAPGKLRSPRHRSDAGAVPEVLVPRDQEILLASYVQQWRTHRYVRLTTEVVPTPALEAREIAPIQIDVRDVKLLTEPDSR